MKKKLKPITPGEILLEEFMKPLGIAQNQLARELKVPPGRVNRIILGHRVITADTALRLGKFFNVSPQSWLNLQNHYDLKRAELKSGRNCGGSSR